MINYFSKLLFVVAIFATVFTSCNEDKKPENKECTYVTLDWPEEISKCITDAEVKGIRDGTKNPNEVFKRLKRDCPDVKKIDNNYLLYSLKTYPDAILVSSKKDMMKKLKEKAKADKCCIKKLIIRGHGDDGNISVGAGKTNGKCKYINGDPTKKKTYNKDDWKKDFSDLKGLLCKDAEFVLEGCNVGRGDVGRFKLEEIAKEYGVNVSAPTVTIKGSKKIGDLGTNVRKVKPPVGDVKPPSKTARKETNKEIKEDKKKDKISDGMNAISKNIAAIGFYPSYYVDMPNVVDNPELPITNEEWIATFVNQIEKVGYEANQEGYKVNTTILIRYADGTYDIAYALYGDMMFGIDMEEYNDVQFSLTDQGTDMVADGIIQTIGNTEE